jgi:hypothetical protein
VEVDAIGLAWEAGGVEEFFGAGEIEGVLGDVGLVGPVIGRRNAVGYLRLIVKEIADQGLAVGGVGQGLADFAAGECGIFEIETEVGGVVVSRTRAPEQS